VKRTLSMAAAALVLGMASPARADIALLRSGATLKVTSHRVENGTVTMDLQGGGQVAVAESELRGIVPDEVLEELAAAPATGGSELASLIEEAARRHAVDPELLRAVIGVESAFRPDAVSRKGAQGLMQLMPATARSLGVKDAFDPADNVEGGTRHLRTLIDRYHGDVERALAAYNAGEGAVQRHGGVPPYAETRAYVAKVLARAQAHAGDSQ
jgi:soluble lytic murein transglycosylase-like protein